MKVSVNIEFETNNSSDMEVFNRIAGLLHSHNDSNRPVNRVIDADQDEAWKQCSWEIIAFAVAVISLKDGMSPEKGVYAFFDTLCGNEATKICGPLTERSISSRVGRTSVICKKFGDFRLMEVGVRKRDKAKRVYINPEANEALMRLLRSDWGKDFFNYMHENSYEAPDLDNLDSLLTDD